MERNAILRQWNHIEERINDQVFRRRWPVHYQTTSTIIKMLRENEKLPMPIISNYSITHPIEESVFVWIPDQAELSFI
ncbi:hypothetical protein [Candidatus Uabimicrobium sp. HlEnr_7]|uniref:hypothetical protein n=1 Tax=Candidatus Uabimicrobium helgolandensis TaxID=3095367 RepID=UPI003558D2EF